MALEGTAPTISVVMPMFDAAPVVERCLAPLRAMLARGEIAEIVVVDDGSTDGSREIVCRLADIRLLCRREQGGPAAARNDAAATCTGDYLWFVDADVVVAEDAARRLREVLAVERPAAVSGSYDDRPAAANFLSQYKNLVHHYFHQRSPPEASTFWSGCGAVDRLAFLRVGGFDAVRHPFPSMEDVELGYRIRDAGGRILMAPQVQGTHLKEWRLLNLLHTEIFRRAVPWTRLILARSGVSTELNVSPGERARALLAWLLVISLTLGLPPWAPVPAWAPIGAAAIVWIANRELWTFFRARRGSWFALRALAFQQFYYVYSSAAYAAVVLESIVRRRDARGSTYRST